MWRTTVTRKVRRDELLDWQTYSERRDEIRAKIMPIKEPRRIHVGPFLTFLFENTATIRYQIQEMMRAEQIVKEEAILHELETYNGLLGDEGELGCALLIEIDEASQRKPLLSKWLPLPQHLYVKLEDGSKVYASYDEGQIGTDRLSAVQYLKFDTRGAVPVAVGVDFEPLIDETTLTAAQRNALAEDLENASAKA
jgi:hypothetical protein